MNILKILHESNANVNVGFEWVEGGDVLNTKKKITKKDKELEEMDVEYAVEVGKG